MFFLSKWNLNLKISLTDTSKWLLINKKKIQYNYKFNDLQWTHYNFFMEFSYKNAFLHLLKKNRQMFFNMKHILNTANLTSKQVCKCNIDTYNNKFNV